MTAKLTTTLAALIVLAASSARPNGLSAQERLILNSERVAITNSRLTREDPKDDVRTLPCKVFTIELAEGKTYQIDMIHKESKLDPYLRLENSEKKQLAEDDDSGGNLDARIIFKCPAKGDYRIIATSFDGSTGAFELCVRDMGSPSAPPLVTAPAKQN